MPDRISKAERSRIMSLIRSKHTKPEKSMEKALRKANIKFKKHYGPEKIDFALLTEKIAVFVDGCFWHGCKKHYKAPKARAKYWAWKVNYNRQRDRKQARELQKKGWKVVRIWEHSLPSQVESYVQKIARLAKGRRK